MLENLSHLLLSLYEAARVLPPEDFQDFVLELLKADLPFDSCMWGGGAMTPAGLVVNSIHLHNQPLEFLERYAEVKDQDWAAYDLSQHSRVTSLYENPSWNRGRARSGIRAIHERFDIQTAAIDSDIRRDTGLAQWISLYRAKPVDRFEERDRQLLSLLGPHLREALAINRVIHIDTLRTDGRAQPMAIVDVAGMIYHAEPHFLALTGREFKHWGPGPRLPTPLCDWIRGNSDRYTGTQITLRRFPVKDLIFIRAQSRGPADVLTTREDAIARYFANGMTHKKIGQELGISPATVRNHIQRIYAKLGVHSKATLYRRLLTRE